MTEPPAATESVKDGLHEILQNIVRLRIAALLSSCDEATFQHVQEYCGLSKSALSKQVATLERAGLVDVRKGYVGKYPHTWLALNVAGRAALREHLDALQRIATAAANGRS